MIINRIPGFTRLLGKSQGYLGLPVLDQIVFDPAAECDVPAMTTSWEPTPDELKALNAGASVHVRILALDHPPIMLGVGSPPEAH